LRTGAYLISFERCGFLREDRLGVSLRTEHARVFESAKCLADIRRPQVGISLYRLLAPALLGGRSWSSGAQKVGFCRGGSKKPPFRLTFVLAGLQPHFDWEWCESRRSLGRKNRCRKARTEGRVWGRRCQRHVRANVPFPGDFSFGAMSGFVGGRSDKIEKQIVSPVFCISRMLTRTWRNAGEATTSRVRKNGKNRFKGPGHSELLLFAT